MIHNFWSINYGYKDTKYNNLLTYIIAFEGLAYNPQMYTHPQFLPFTALPSIHPIENPEGQYQLTENPQLHPLDLTVNNQ